jgi:hypothetical protein
MIYLGARVGDIRALTCPGLVSSSSRLDRGSFLRIGHCSAFGQGGMKRYHSARSPGLF